jgi:Flp pilus assembly protein TadG
MMKIRRPQKLTENSGQALLELSLVLGLLVLLVLGVVDFSRALQANNIITNVSREGADLVDRGNVQGTDATAINNYVMTALAFSAQPLNMPQNGMMYITVVKGASGNTIQIANQYAWPGSALASKPPSRIGVPPTAGNPSPPAQNMGTFTLAVGNTATVVEVFYNYPSIFSTNAAKITPTLYSKAIF